MKKVIVIFSILIVAFSTFRILPYSIGSVDDSIYRRIVKVTNSENSETLTNYQIFLNVTWDSDMQPDFDDLRFTWFSESIGQEMSISYWIDKYTTSEYALVWVEVPKIRGSEEETLYMYYGDPAITSASNGNETFVFFDGFSTDTTANYQLWSPEHPTTNPNEFSWDSNGWLFVNASIRERYGRNSNLHVYHKTAVMDPSEEQYWLETRCKAFGDGWLDYFGVSKLYKRDSMPQNMYFRMARVMQGIRDVYPMNRSGISGGWGSWEFGESSNLTTSVIDQWFRIGLGTALDGTVIGRFHDDDYGELDTLVGQTTHQDTKWWVDMIISRILTNDWATMHAYFDYIRVRKFTDPEPSISIGQEQLVRSKIFLIEKYSPVLLFDEEESFYPTDFFFDDFDIANNPSNYNKLWSRYVYAHTVETENYICLQYWTYYSRDDKSFGLEVLGAHDHDWESVYVYLEKQDGSYSPAFVTYFRHWMLDDLELVDFFVTCSDTVEMMGTHPIVHVALDSHASYEKTTHDYGVFVFEIPGPQRIRIPVFEPCDGGLELDYDNFQIVYVDETDSWPEQFGTLDAPWVRERWNWGDPVFSSPVVKFSMLSLHEPGSKLHLHVYDNQSKHVGFNVETSEVDTEIPESYYEDLGNTIFIVLPENITDFRFTVDGKYAQQTTEKYQIAISTIRGSQIIEEVIFGDITKGQVKEFAVNINENGIEINELITVLPFWLQWWFWVIVAVGIGALVGAVYFLKKRKPSAPKLPVEGPV